MDRSRYAELFRSEAREHLATMTRLLLQLERDPGADQALEELFRAVHTLKGSSAAMGYDAASELAHGLEHLLTRMRDRTVRRDGAVVDLLLQGGDALERAIEAPGSGAPPVILDRLAAYAGQGSPTAPANSSRPATRIEGPALRVRVELESDAALPAVRAALVLRAARTLGQLVEVTPGEDEILAGQLEGSFRFLLVGPVAPEAVREAVIAAGEVAVVEVEPVETGERDSRPASPDPPVVRVGPIVRVPQARLDALVDQVGELLISRDRLRRVLGASVPEGATDVLDGVSRQIDDLREQIMGLRMVPVGEVFDRFPRMVRDAARTLGRKVDLQIEGREEEVDRGLLNEVADLLVHLLRNAVDHGIEPPEQRLSAGKSETGRIRVRAVREGSSVRIEVSDDGRGLQRERIVATAAARGLIESPEAELSDTEIWGLLTAPGFSTSEAVTEVSGRGVGLDMVRSRVQSLGGSLEIRSESGRGSSFGLRLPLSLTLVRALRFEVGGAYYSVPLSGVVEVAEVDVVGEGRVRVREEEMPALDLRELLAGGVGAGGEDEPAVVVIQFGGERAGLIVDALEEQHQAVVKPFDAPLEALPIFSGATILPDGRPSLILDPARLLGLASAGRRGRP